MSCASSSQDAATRLSFLVQRPRAGLLVASGGGVGGGGILVPLYMLFLRFRTALNVSRRASKRALKLKVSEALDMLWRYRASRSWEELWPTPL